MTNKVPVQVTIFGLPYEFHIEAENREKIIDCAERLNKLIGQKKSKYGDGVSQVKLLTVICLDLLVEQMDNNDVLGRIENMLDKSL